MATAIKYVGEAAAQAMASKLIGIINEKYESVTSVEFTKVVSELPSEGEANYLYLVPGENTETQNQYDEYVWVNSAWEKLGSVQLSTDLTGLKEAVEGKQDALTAGENVTIENDVISVDLSSKQDALTAGDGISIDGATISCTASYEEVTADDVDAWDVWTE